MESTEHKYSDSVSADYDIQAATRKVTYPTEEEGEQFNIWRYIENELIIINSQTKGKYAKRFINKRYRSG